MPYYVACTAPLLRTHPHTHIHPHNTPVGASVRLGCLVIHDLYEASHTHGHTQSRRWTHAVTQKDTRSHADGHTQSRRWTHAVTQMDTHAVTQMDTRSHADGHTQSRRWTHAITQMDTHAVTQKDTRSHAEGHTQSRRWTHAVTQMDTRSHADGHTQISALSTQVFTSIRMHTHRAQRDESKRGGQRWYLCTHGTPEVQDYPLLMRPLFLNFF